MLSKPLFEASRHPGSERTPDERNADLAAHLAVGMAEQITGIGSKEAAAAETAARDFANEHPVPSKGKRALWTAGLFAAIGLAVAGCDDPQTTENKTNHATVSEINHRVMTGEMTTEELETRIAHDRRQVETFIQHHVEAFLARDPSESEIQDFASTIADEIDTAATHAIASYQMNNELYLNDREDHAFTMTLGGRIERSLSEQLGERFRSMPYQAGRTAPYHLIDIISRKCLALHMARINL